MLATLLLTLSLLTNALSAPTPFDAHLISVSLLQAAFSHVEKRESSSRSSASWAVQDLLGKAFNATASDGKCSSACSPWVDVISDCVKLESYMQIGTCSCGEASLSAMKDCGECNGPSSVDDASTFSSFCHEELHSAFSSSPSSTSNSNSPPALYTSRTSTASSTSISAFSVSTSANTSSASEILTTSVAVVSPPQTTPTSPPGAQNEGVRTRTGFKLGVVTIVFVGMLM